MNDFEITEALRGEMQGAWHRYLDLLQPFRPALFGYCRRLTGTVWDAEDLVQDTLVKAFGALGSLHQEVRSPRAYLFRVATNLWIDTLRKRGHEVTALSDAGGLAEPVSAPPAAPGAVRDAGQQLMQRLAPQERAAVILKDVLDLSLEETAQVLETTIGAIKAALHRARARLREPEGEPASQRPLPSVSLVDRFVELFNAGDRAGLLALVLDNASVELVGCGLQFGREAHEGERSWFHGALDGHPDWPEVFQFESQRVERAVYRGEPVVLLFRTRFGGLEAMEQVIRLEEVDERVGRLRDYAFCPETVKEVGAELGLEVRTGLYRFPTPSPGARWPAAD